MKSFEKWVEEQGVSYSPEEMVGKKFKFKVMAEEEWGKVDVGPPQHLYGKIVEVSNVNLSPCKGKGIPVEAIDPGGPWFKTAGGSKFDWLPEEGYWRYRESGLLGELTIKDLEN